MESLDALDHIAINDVLCRFFLAFDERDWMVMEDCLATEVFIDYSSSGREQPGVMGGAEFVKRRRDGDGVKGRCNYLILRFDRDFKGEGGDFYHSCGAYEFLFTKAESGWKITSIMQRALQSWGNRQLHAGTKAEAQGVKA